MPYGGSVGNLPVVLTVSTIYINGKPISIHNN
nr:MAG TPA: hypothetical protein [Caudoviricetes sp.]